MRVTALLYSGRPNPSWTLGGEEADAIERALADMAPLPDASERLPGLGYAGVRIDFVDRGGERQQWVLAEGIGRNRGRRFADAGRRVERALLEAGIAQDADPALPRFV